MKTTLRLSFLSLAISALLIGCGKQNAIIDAHNEMARIEKDTINGINSIQDANSQAEYLRQGINRMKKVDLTGCPEDYRDAFHELIDVWKNCKSALEAGNIPAADQFLSQSPIKAAKLNRIAEKHGVVITGGL
tara:strand:+ start:384 stop:782 length:399 start_codon:yes stop_codon:yes gene_type:complete